MNTYGSEDVLYINIAFSNSTKVDAKLNLVHSNAKRTFKERACSLKSSKILT